VQGQAEVIGRAFAASAVDPRSIGYVEAHGTGTSLGDPIEFAALSQAFRKHTDKAQFCGLGSVKSNIGHLDVAAGLAGTIKTALALQHNKIPPTINFETVSPHLDLANSPFYIADTVADFAPSDQPRRAAVSSFGIGGTNTHTILEQPPERPQSPEAAAANGPYLVPLSARTEEQLKQYAAALLAHVSSSLQTGNSPDLADLAFTMQVGREPMECRLVCVVNDASDLCKALDEYCRGKDRAENCHTGHAGKSGDTDGWLDPEEGQELIARWLENRELLKLARAWAKGKPVDWKSLHPGFKPRRISLPTYPFAKERYGIESAARAVSAATSREIMHAPLGQDMSGFSDTVPLVPGADLADEVQATVTGWISQLLNVAVQDIEGGIELTQYGLDSISSIQLVNRINQAYGLELSLTIFYEQPTLSDFARHLVTEHGAAVAARHGRSNRGLAAAERLEEPAPPIEQPKWPMIELTVRSERGAVMNGSKAHFVNGSTQSLSRPQTSPIATTAPRALPPSYAQERLLLAHQNANVGSAYNLPMAFRLVGSLDTAVLEASVAEVVRRHESLRTRFTTVDGLPVQIVEPSVAFQLAVVDLVHLHDAERRDEAWRVAHGIVRRPFDLEAAPLFRVGLIRVRPAEHLLVMAAHHIISDGWSMEILIREVSAQYSAFSRGLRSPLPELAVQYADHAIRQRQQVEARLLDRQISYWVDRLADAPVLSLPTDRPRPSVPSYRGSTALFNFPEHDVAALRSLAQREGASLFLLLFAAFNIVAARLSGQQDVVIGTPVAGRGSLDVENVIGFFINMLALRTDLSGEPTFRQLLKRVKDAALSAFAHQDVPLARIETEIGAVRDLAQQPLFRVLFGLQKVSAQAAHFSGLEAFPVNVENDTSRRDVSFFMYETADGLFGTLEYATDLFDPSTIDAMLTEFRSVLLQIIGDPDSDIAVRHSGDRVGGNGSTQIVADAPTSLDPSDWGSFRVQGHRMLDDMLDYLEGIRARPVWQPIPDGVRARFREPLPAGPTDLAVVHEEFMANILPFATGNAHPGFMGWVHGGGNPDGMLAEMLAAGLNANLGGRDHVPMEVEKQIGHWARELFGFPAGATGLFVTGTSMANMIALLVARHAMAGDEVRRAGIGAFGGLVAYTSAAAHGCISQAMDLAGIGTDSLRQIPTDANHAIDVALLEKAIVDDRARGLRPFLIVGTAGSVDIGAIDDLEALAAIAEREAIWFHVDGAFGALGMLAPEIAPRLAGMEKADSLAFDFHKWGQVPYDAGFIMVRDGAQHLATFTNPAAYLRRETRGLAAGSPWFCDFGPDLSRGFRALKTWFTIKVHGAARIGAVISRTCELAQYMKRRVEAHPELELLAPVQLNIVCFRYRCADPDTVNAAIAADLHESGIVAPSTTVLGGQLAIRAAIVNHRTEIHDIDAAVEATIRFGRARTESRASLQAAREINPYEP